MTGPPVLADDDRRVLELAVRGLAPGAMANAIRDLGTTQLAYYRQLNRILETEAAAAAYPAQVRLLRAARDKRISGTHVRGR